MSDLRKAAADALRALEVATTPLARDRQEVLRARDALRAALAQDAPRQHPPLTKELLDAEGAAGGVFAAGALAQEAEPVAVDAEQARAVADRIDPFTRKEPPDHLVCAVAANMLRGASPAAPAALLLTEEQIDAYIADYALEYDDGTHTPTEAERFLLKDAIMGLTAEHAPAAVPCPHIRSSGQTHWCSLNGPTAAPAVTDAMVAAARAAWMDPAAALTEPWRWRAAIEAALAAKEK